jgi:hypothetical protein
MHAAHPHRLPWYRTKAFNFTLGLVVTVGCLWWAVVDMADGESLGSVLRQIGAAFSQANYVSLLPMWLLLFAFYWLKAWRWQMLLTPLGRYPVRALFPSMMMGFAFNNLLPAHLGELVRVFMFCRQSRQAKTAVLGSVVLERIFDVLAILAFLSLGLLLVPAMDVRVREYTLYVAAAVGLALLGAGAYLIWTGPVVAFIEGCLERIPIIPAGVRHRLARMLEAGAAGLASLRNGRLLLGIVVTSLLQWAINGLLIHLSLWSFGFRLSPLVSCIVLGVVAFGVTVPSSPGYFGVIQVCFLTVLRLFTEDKVGVMAASIYFHMAQWIPVTAVGLWYFLRSGLHVADVEARVEEEFLDDADDTAAPAGGRLEAAAPASTSEPR